VGYTGVTTIKNVASLTANDFPPPLPPNNVIFPNQRYLGIPDINALKVYDISNKDAWTTANLFAM
jgi:hypothetical protein